MGKKKLNFDQSALLLIDLQHTYSAESAFKTKNWDLIISNSKILLFTCREKKIPIIFVRMWCHPDGFDAHPNHPKNEKGKPAYAVAGTKEAEIVDELRPEEGEIIINKQRFSAFYQTNLDITLKGLGVNHLLMSGVSTDGCLLTSVYDAFFRCYKITIVEDACGASSITAHMTSIIDMANWIYGCNIFKTIELIKAMKGEDYRAWFWKRPGQYLYTIETVKDMYKEIVDGD